MEARTEPVEFKIISTYQEFLVITTLHNVLFQHIMLFLMMYRSGLCIS